ncbi:hypothetical protein AB205_0180080 [Aquarana catesbeiana]|nr:hypothetical protein AB205_0180080 [Aquarana catesbeiana]
MVWNCDLEKIKENINDVQQKMKNRLNLKHTNIVPFCHGICYFKSSFKVFLKPNSEHAHSVSICAICHYGISMYAFCKTPSGR